jgi:hypothetical protein
MLKKIWTFLQPKIASLSLTVKWLGVLLVLLSILGVFKHHKRIAFYENLQMKKEMPADSVMAKKVMREFKLKDDEIKRTKKIMLKDMRYIQVGTPTLDTFVAEGDYRELKNMGKLIELQQWANSGSRLYEWLGFILVAVGVVIDTILHWQQNRKINREIPLQPSD